MNLPGNYSCACDDGYKLQNRGTCIAASGQMNLYLAHKTNLQRYSKGGDDRTTLMNKNFTDFDFDYAGNTIYYVDGFTRYIYMADLDGNDKPPLHVENLGRPSLVAFDWIAKNLYVYDFRSQRIDLVHVSKNETMQANFVSSGIDTLSSMAVDPLAGYLFFTDRSGEEVVERINLDGTGRKIILSKDLYTPVGMTLDLNRREIYFADSHYDYIKVMDYDGNKQRIVFEDRFKIPHVQAMTNFENKLYIADLTKLGILQVDKFAGPSSYSRLVSVPNNTMVRLKAVHPLTQPQPKGQHVCASKANPCEHICVPMPLDTGNSFKCVCSYGYQLAPNGSCFKIENFMIVVTSSLIRGIDLNGTARTDAMVPIIGNATSKFSAAAFDARREYIYYSDNRAGFVYRVKRNGSGKQVIITHDLMQVDGLDLDWVTQNLYYSDFGAGLIGVVNVRSDNGPFDLRTVIKRGLHQPLGIAVSPILGLAFWTEIWADKPGPNKAVIRQMDLSGDNMKDFITKEVGIPRGISIDHKGKRVYWCDSFFDWIRSTNMDGRLISTLSSTGMTLCSSITIDNNTRSLYYSDYRRQEIGKISLNITTTRSTIHKEVKALFIKVYSKDDQPEVKSHQCVRQNGDCKYLCFSVPSPKIRRVCGCPTGMKLGKNNLDCEATNMTVPSTCPENTFQCRNKHCIQKSYRCDRENDCLDNSDEENCTDVSCSPNQFKCTNGKCIMRTWKCDGEDDCGDRSDESSCTQTTCPPNNFRCDNGACTRMTDRCDTFNDCGDGSDEKNCTDHTCSSMLFTCRNGRCISSAYRCDGDNDCYDNSDEMNCPAHRCFANQFACAGERKCVSVIYRCDGVKDCKNGSDEANCPSRPEGGCQNGYRKCSRSETCIPLTWVCDGVPDCLYHDDEQSCRNRTCPPKFFLCDNGRCIPESYKCDKDNDCGDNSDEKISLNCKAPPFRCPRATLKCANRTCVEHAKICDGKKDCPDGVDEGILCNNDDCAINNGGCSDGCMKTPFGATCYCPQGSSLSNDTKTCEDTDECKERIDVCSQKCVNLKGGYKCLCDDGYTIIDKRICQADDRGNATMYVANRNSLITVNIVKKLQRTISISGTELITGVDFHWDTNRIFFAEGRLRKIFSVLPDGTNRTTLVSSGLGLVEGLAVDWIAGNMYWVDYLQETIEVSSLEGTNRIVLFTENITNPRGLVLDPRTGFRKFFWSDWGQNPRIEMAWMDGTNRMTIIDDDIFWPSGLTIDYTTNKLYFSDAKYDHIDVCNYDGSERRRLVADTQFLRHPYGLALFEDTIYWTDREANSVHACNKFNCENKTVMTKRVSAPIGLTVYNPVRQPPSDNPCLTASCSHLCLLSPNTAGYRCACPSPLVLDGSTCQLDDKPIMIYQTQAKISGLPGEKSDKDEVASPFVPMVASLVGPDFDYNWENQTVYWIKGTRDTAYKLYWSIAASSLDGHKEQTILAKTLVRSPTTVAFDWVSGNLYIGDNATRTIEVVRIANLSHHHILSGYRGQFDNETAMPRAITLDPYQGKLYWLDTGYKKVPFKLGVMNMDGTSSKILLKKDKLGDAQYLALDLEKQALYWSDITYNKVSKLDLKTIKISTVYRKSDKPQGLSIYGNKLYLADKTLEVIMEIDTDDPTSVSTFKKNIGGIQAFKVYYNRTSAGTTNACAVKNGGCSQLCLPKPNGKTCACTKGYTYDNGKCKVIDSFLVVGQTSGLLGYPLEGTVGVGLSLQNTSYFSVFQLAVDTRHGHIYWGDIGNRYKGVMRSDAQGNNVTKFITTGIGSIAIRGIAYDWIAENLYFTNAYHSDTYLEVCKLDGTYRHILRHTKMSSKDPEQPRSIAVNPLKRYLYWADYGQSPKIVRTYLDGTNLKVLVNTGLRLPNDIAIDIANGDVYWTDLLKDWVQSVSWNGGNRRTIVGTTSSNLLPKPAGIAVFGDFMWVGDHALRKVFKINKTKSIAEQTRDKWITVASDLKTVMDMAVFDKRAQPYVADSSPCQKNNGGCEQLCFAAPNATDATCLCAHGQVQPNGTCKRPESYLIYATPAVVTGMNLDPNDKSKPFETLKQVEYAMALAIDTYNRRIFIGENAKRRIWVYNIDTKQTTVLMDNNNVTETDTSHAIGRIEDMAYDWISGRLYWADSVYMRIRSVDPSKITVNGTDRITLAVVYTPYSITLDPCRGYMYWTKWSRASSIQRATLAGRNQLTIVDTGLYYPMGLVIDGEMLYWSDNLYGKVERAVITDEGINYRETIVEHLAGPSYLSINEDYLYIADRRTYSILRVNKNTGTGLKSLISGIPNTPYGLEVYSKDRQPMCDNPCDKLNGYCSHTCHVGPKNTTTCQCPDQMTLVNNERMCVSGRRECGSQQFTCVSGDKKCISFRYACDTDPDCDDGSDENPVFCADHQCKPYEFMCDNGRCIPALYRCDTDVDCKDASDEKDCEYPTCGADQIACLNGKCVRNTSICDGIDDCKDGNITDESGCPPMTCKPGYSACGNGICIPRRKFCDGNEDCPDKSDEQETVCAGYPCNDDDFRCSNHRCIPAAWHCDGENDCGDGSDEQKNVCSSPDRTCFGKQFTCLKSRTCIEDTWVCDGEDDCDDSSDEDRVFCAKHPCQETQFDCPSNRDKGGRLCLSRMRLCDGRKDCLNGEDEKQSCPAPTCRPDEFLCPNSTDCLPNRFKCDRFPDCANGEDEKGCTYQPCNPPDWFLCQVHRQCIANNRTCDGVKDCKDGSDEASSVCLTTPAPCPNGGFRCKNRKCIDHMRLCNNFDDCGDKSDEIGCGVNECNNTRINQCAHICVNTVVGFHCACRAGYTLESDRKNCRELNECDEVAGACTQLCTNLPGSYLCDCGKGYRLQRDGKTCKKTDNIDPFILFANRFYIRKLALDSSSYEVVSEGLENAGPMDFDYQAQKIYVVDVGKKQIVRMDMNGSNLEVVVRHNTPQPEGITVDWIGRKLYWVDYRLEAIMVSEMNGTNRRYLYKGSPFTTPFPRPICAHPRKGYLFWADWNLQAFIARIGLDGSEPQKIITTGLVWPNGLTVDFVTDRLWWVDAHLDRIEFAKIDGTARHTVLMNQPHPFAITIFENMMYWTDWNKKTLHKANRFTGKDNTTMRVTVHRPMDLHVVHPLRQPNGSNPCGDSNGGCSHLCLLSPGGGYKCLCPDYFLLAPDNKTCVAQCTDDQFECSRSDHKCIPKLWKCDDEDDCKNGEDEENCKKSECPPTFFTCGNKNCTRPQNLCDGKDDCGDMSDENSTLCSDRQCQLYEFRCGTGKCIPESWACDTEYDCPDQSDELPKNQNCHARRCPSNYFKCGNSTKCIPRSWVCDVDNDCGDWSDEQGCYEKPCPSGWFNCTTNYRCIPAFAVCDGVDNCRDNSDENKEKCPKCHPQGDFTCKSGQCIPLRWRCNFKEDCRDKSDEDASLCSQYYRKCSESEFRCDNHRCIRRKFLCDHDNDCQDNSDEGPQCSYHQCLDNQFTCDSGHCVDEALVCDGNRDCLDMTDERNCTTRYPNGRNCPRRQFQCDNKICLDREWLCDGDDDCGDGSDETRKVCENVACPPNIKFRCNNFRCIPKYRVCDKVDDCKDGSDENRDQCKIAKQCKTGEFRCGNEKCISGALVCDLNDDCGDASDERHCMRNNRTCQNPPNGGCEQKCVQLSQNRGYYCACNSTFKVASYDHYRCEDLNECSSKKTNDCPQVCINLKGSHKCECAPGYRAMNNQCKATGRDPLVLLFATGPEIRQYRSSTKSYSDAVLSGRRIRSIAVDTKMEYIFWVDSSLRTLSRALLPSDPLALGSPQDLQIEGMKKPESLAVDWVAKIIYWTDSVARSISVTNYDGYYKKTIVSDPVMTPMAIAVNPKLGLMFWTDRGSGNARIESAWMNGEMRKIIVQSRLSNPTGLTIDYAMDDRLYWCDTKESTIESANYNGTDRIVVIGKGLKSPFSLDVFEGYLYWVSPSDEKLWRMDKFGHGVNSTIQTGLRLPNDVKAYQSKRYDTTIKNRCVKSGCSQLCLLVPNGFRCACPDGVDFIPGTNTTCDAVVLKVRDKPRLCKCYNNGLCIVNQDRLECQCAAGFTGPQCKESVTKGSTVTQRSTTTVSIGPARTEAVSKGTDNKQIIAIVVPIVIIAVLLLIVVIVIVVLIMRGGLRKGMAARSGHGEYRAGAPGIDSPGVTADSSVVMDSLDHDMTAMPEYQTTQFSNPVYATVESASDPATVDAKEVGMDLNENEESKN